MSMEKKDLELFESIFTGVIESFKGDFCHLCMVDEGDFHEDWCLVNDCRKALKKLRNINV